MLVAMNSFSTELDTFVVPSNVKIGTDKFRASKLLLITCTFDLSQKTTFGRVIPSIWVNSNSPQLGSKLFNGHPMDKAAKIIGAN